MQRFRDQVIVVTGAARGMGRACALAFAAEGARVALLDVQPAALNEAVAEATAAGCVAQALTCDVSRWHEVQDSVATIARDYGSVDVLVNNAGVLRATTPLEDISEAEWDLVMDINLKGMFLMAKAVLPAMRERRGGKIINISSSAGRSTSELGGAHYTVSKTGVLGLTRHMAREYGRYGINIVSVCPGLVETPMIHEHAGDEKLDHWLRQIPLGRFATPQEEAELVLFLASDEARYITGATIDFNGGSLLL